MIQSQVVGLPELYSKLRQLDAVAAERNLVLAGTAGGQVIRNAAAANAPKLTRTLERSIHVEVVDKSRARVTIMVGTNVIYAAIHEFGGIITPKHAKMLAFELDGKLIFAHSVRINATPYMRPAFDHNVQKAIAEIKAVLKILLMKVAT